MNSKTILSVGEIGYKNLPMLLSLLQNFSLKIKRGASLVAVPKIFLKVFLKKYKLYNQIKREIVPKKIIKREIHILTITTIKKHVNI